MGGNELPELPSVSGMISRLLPGVVRAIYQRVRLRWQKWRAGQPLFSDRVAAGYAHSLLSGNIVRATAFRNAGEDNEYIAGLWKTERTAYEVRAFVLQRFGATFRQLWISEPLYGPVELLVRDYDGDGKREVCIKDESYGSGAGSRSALVYSTAARDWASVREFMNWQAPAKTSVEPIPEGNQELLSLVEKAAVEFDMLQGNPSDFIDPQFAVKRWHSENGTPREGRIRFVRFPGMPVCGASVAAQVDTEKLLWIGYFKGPLYGYLKETNEHFVAYSDAWSYNWTSCLVADGATVWFGLHSEVGVMRFTLMSSTEGELARLHRVGDLELPEVTDLDWREGSLFLNGTIRLRGAVAYGPSTVD